MYDIVRFRNQAHPYFHEHTCGLIYGTMKVKFNFFIIHKFLYNMISNPDVFAFSMEDEIFG